MKTEIINTGTELVTGQTKNTNGVFLAKELMKLGISVWRHSVVGDQEEDLQKVIRQALEDSDMVILTGGLGPTVDDRTKEVVADILGLPMELDEKSFSKIKEFFKNRGVRMPETNRKQAVVPEGSIVLDNEVGTAPGLIIESGTKTLVILPGPPVELEPMFSNKVIPYLQEKQMTGSSPIEQKIIKLWGIGESKVQELLSDFHQDFKDVEISYRATRGEVWVKLTALNQGSSKQSITKLNELVVQRFGEKVFGFDDDTMESVVAKLLLKYELTVSLAESCTGGLIAKKLTDQPGSSQFFMYGVVSYSNEAKVGILGVSPKTLEQYGAVSEQTALEMAKGVKAIGKTDLAVSVTGIAGPGGGSKEKPVGLVYIGMAEPNKTIYKKNLFYGDRENVRELTARTALNLIRLYILNLQP